MLVSDTLMKRCLPGPKFHRWLTSKNQALSPGLDVDQAWDVLL